MAKKGEGTFSEVLKAQCIKNGKYVAIKCMKNHFDSLDQVNNLREIQVGSGLLCIMQVVQDLLQYCKTCKLACITLSCSYCQAIDNVALRSCSRLCAVAWGSSRTCQAVDMQLRQPGRMHASSGLCHWPCFCQALRRLSPHPNIIKLLEVLYDQPTGRLALVFELMDMNIYELIR